MARRLDFSPIDYRQAILADPAGKAIAGAIGQVGQQVAGAYQRKEKERKAREADFVEQMKWDTEITGNNVVDNRVALEYDKVKQKWLDTYSERQGRLTPADRVEMQSDFLALNRFAGVTKAELKKYEDAKKRGLTKDGRENFDVNHDGWANLMTMLSGDAATSDIMGFINQQGQSNTDVAYLNWKPMEMDNYLFSQADDFQKNAAEGTIETSKKIIDAQGNETTTTTKVTPYDVDEFTERAIAGVKGDALNQRVYLGIEGSLSEEEKALAREKYGDDFPLIQYYYRDKRKSDIERHLAPEVHEKTVDRPPSPRRKKDGFITINFGGGKAKQGSVTPQDTKVEGVDVGGYVEFAKAGRSDKVVSEVTLKGAQLMEDGELGESEDISIPANYRVIGVGTTDDKIILSTKKGSGVGAYWERYMVPRKGHEHFLTGLVTDADMAKMGKTTTPRKEAKATKKAATELPEDFWR